MIKKISSIDIFLIIIILLNIFDFLEILPTELDYAKKIISWSMLGLLLYKASPTRIIFGSRLENIDLFLILTYFSLVTKNLISYAQVSIENAASLELFFTFILENALLIQELSFIIGLLGLVLISVYISTGQEFSQKSIMGVLHEQGKPIFKPIKLTTRFTITFIVLLAFFLFVFNLMMEWLAIAIDAPLLLIAFLFYSILLVQNKITTHGFIEKVGNIGSKTYTEFIEYFRNKNTFMLGVSGLLVLHILTDIGNFIIPYITTLQDPLYLSVLNEHHNNIWHILSHDLNLTQTTFEKATVLLLFLLNMIGYILLFLSPAIIWVKLKQSKKITTNNKVIMLLFTALPAVLLAPLFKITSLNNQSLVGVDIQTTSMITTAASPIMLITLIAVFLFLTMISNKSETTKSILKSTWIAITVIFFGMYISYFFIDIATYYQNLIVLLIKQQRYIIGITFFIFQALTILFYIGGFGGFVYNVIMNLRRKV